MVFYNITLVSRMTGDGINICYLYSMIVEQCYKISFDLIFLSLNTIVNIPSFVIKSVALVFIWIIKTVIKEF